MIDLQESLQHSLRVKGLDVLLCVLPVNVLLLSGYWPVMANTLAIFTCAGHLELIAPADEREEAGQATHALITTYEPSSLKQLIDPVKALGDKIAARLAALGLTQGRAGCEFGYAMQPASYLTMSIYQGSLMAALQKLLPSLQLTSADELLEEARAMNNPEALAKMRRGCAVAKEAFANGIASIVQGATEQGVAGAFLRAHYEANAKAQTRRSQAYFYCMSGPNSATANRAYARTRHRTIEQGDVVMMHCNTATDGWWTDITRTFVVGTERPEHRRVRDTIAAARLAALETIRPGVLGKIVDQAARRVMEKAGYESNFMHATGHGVGIVAANPNGRPRIHPCSEDKLEEGMTFNIEPAAYFEGNWGMRHCDVVVVGAQGAEVLTDF